MKISLLKSSLEVGGKFFYLVTTVSHIILPISCIKPFHVFIDWFLGNLVIGFEKR